MTIDEIFLGLSALDRWAPYTLLAKNDGSGKKDKIPHNGQHGLSTDCPSNWMPLIKALEQASEWTGLHGVGFVMTGGVTYDDWTLVGFDFDGVDFKEWKPPFKTYTEKSPSKKGVRMFAWAPTAWAQQYQDTLNARPPHCAHAEVYIGSAPRFLTLTFDVIQSEEIAQLSDKDLRVVEGWGIHDFEDKPPLAAAPALEAGTAFDWTRLSLNTDQRHLVEGTGDIDHSNILYGLIIKAADAGRAKEDILASMVAPGPIWQVCLNHRNNSEAKALQYAKDQINKAYGESKTGKREKLISFNETWGDKSMTTPEQDIEEVDNSYQWELDNAPEAYAAYVEWFMQNARLLHLGFAMQSADLFFQSCAGWNIKTPSGLRANKWSLALAPSSGGKDAIGTLAEEAIRQLRATGVCPAICVFEDTFSSGQAMWGHLMQSQQVIWFHPELASQLTQLSKAEHGNLFEKQETLLKLSDSSMKPSIQPPRYAISTQGKYKLQPINYGWFSSFGTGVLGDIRAFTDGALKSGLLNRYEVDAIEGKVVIGNSGGYSPIPKIIVDWAKTTFMKNAATAMKQHGLSAIGKAIEFSTYAEYDADWRAAMQWQLDGCEVNAGIYGRSAEKMVKRALIHAFAGGGKEISNESFNWGKNCVKSRVKRFKNHFEMHGGGAKSPEDALCRAFMQAFMTPLLSKQHARDGYLRLGNFRTSGGVAWKDSRDEMKEEKALNWLKSNHYIEEMDKNEKAEKGLRADARAFRKLRDYE